MEIDWKKDYQDEFICPYCEKLGMSLAGVHRNKRQFSCYYGCGKKTVVSVELSKRSLYTESRLKDEKVDWRQDYHGEFVCPNCQTSGMIPWGIKKPNYKRQFRCSACRDVYQDSCQIDIHAVADPTNFGVTWYTNHRIKDFICPKCQETDIYFNRIQDSKKQFICRSCQTRQSESLNLKRNVISRFSQRQMLIKPFDFNQDRWDLRAINLHHDLRDEQHLIVNFASIKINWFKIEVKQYIYYLCQAQKTFSTIKHHLSALRFFSRYLQRVNVVNFNQINRELILDYLTQEQKITKDKLGGLRGFFLIGTTRGWFNIDPDIIRNDDYPKQHRGNPDPLSDTVREQIEQNLHKLPNLIARM